MIAGGLTELRSTGRMAPVSEPAVVANRKMVRPTALYGGGVRSYYFRSTDLHVVTPPTLLRLPVLLRTSDCRKGGARTGRYVRASTSTDGSPLWDRTGHASNRATSYGHTNQPIGKLLSFLQLRSGRHSRPPRGPSNGADVDGGRGGLEPGRLQDR